MNLVTDLFWMAGAAVSLGFLTYGAFLLMFAPKFKNRATAAPRLYLAS